MNLNMFMKRMNFALEIGKKMENRVHKQRNITSTYGGISSSSSTYCYKL
ncbi:hypothetical protein RchiOBHm_Chr2g0143811 [Rosa chinensis]|uniref:Uncharacterized protein n=1 Tax=Rosa chinensis TaxID=74649 RepID=A0A2P6RY79_ROSCH|nr:hypothetical protein RchiOBHm_Chr2g0143811 [Rosa chinensis]